MSHNHNLPLEMLGILSCVSDGVIVYSEQKVLFFNAEGHLLLNETQHRILDLIKFDIKEKNLHQVDIEFPERSSKFIAYCMPIQWQGSAACVAIIRRKRDLDILLESSSELDDIAQQHRSRLELLLKSAGDGYWDWHIPTANVYFSLSWKKMLGYELDDLAPSFHSWVNLIHPDDLGQFLLTWTNYMDSSSDRFNIEYRVLCKNMQYIWVEAHGIKELDDKGEIVRLAGFSRNINQRKLREALLKEFQDNLQGLVKQRTLELELANSKLSQIACQDSLTLLHNRRSFDKNLNTQWLASKRYNTPLSLLLMDIDHFKGFNDSYGHQAGDEYLKQVAQAIKKAMLRPTDLAARYGGEEFVVILQDTDLQGAIKVAKNIQENIRLLSEIPINPLSQQPITLSIGISSNVEQTECKNLIRLADKAMYAAKDNGRNQICFFEADAQSISYITHQPLAN